MSDLRERVARAIWMADVEPLEKGDCIPFEDTYGTLRAQVFAEADAAIALVLEEAARVAEKWDTMRVEKDGTIHRSSIGVRVAEDIRALKEKTG